MNIPPFSDEQWSTLVKNRREALRTFLEWANSREQSGQSMRLASRHDLSRIREIERQFPELWWAIVVYTCFDSVVGTLTVARYFQQPMDPAEAKVVLTSINLPRGSVQHHRTQPGNKGAKIALISACARAQEFRSILHNGKGFHDRFQSLLHLRARQWGRTTCFDLLIRAGQLGVGGQTYEPEFAYLAGSTGPKNGFQQVWGIQVTTGNAPHCEALLRKWTESWAAVTADAGVQWSGAPYTPADFENALCIFQHRNAD